MLEPSSNGINWDRSPVSFKYRASVESKEVAKKIIIEAIWMFVEHLQSETCLETLHTHASSLRESKFLLFLEEHREANNSSVDQQTTENRHDHGGELDLSAVCKNDRKC